MTASRAAIRYLIVSSLLAAAAMPALSVERAFSLSSYETAITLVARGLDALGGEDALAGSGGISLAGRGSYDLSTRLQGQRADSAEPVPLTEALVLDTANDRLAYESHTRVNADAREWIRYVYDGAGPILFLDLINKRASWDTAMDVEDDRPRYERMTPHRLLRSALDHRDTLRYLGPSDDPDRPGDVVSFSLATGETISIFMDALTGLPTGLEYLLDMPLLGDTSVHWDYADYRPVDGIGPYPGGYRVWLGRRLLKEVEYVDIEAGISAGAHLFDAPDGIALPERPARTKSQAEHTDSAPALPAPRELAQGVFLVPNIRPGFHPLVVDFGDFLLTVDAPAGWFELQQVPARNWVPGVTSSSVGRRLLDTLSRSFPDKPLRYLVLTHHHSDHAGGVRPFIDAGVTILASAETAEVVAQAAASRVTLRPDALTGRERAPEIDVVDDERIVTYGDKTVHILNIGVNPHAKGMLVVHLPESRILYQSDLFEPLPDPYFPSRERVPVMRFFADWLDHSGLDVEHVYAIHGTARVTDEQLTLMRVAED